MGIILYSLYHFIISKWVEKLLNIFFIEVDNSAWQDAVLYTELQVSHASFLGSVIYFVTEAQLNWKTCKKTLDEILSGHLAENVYSFLTIWNCHASEYSKLLCCLD